MPETIDIQLKKGVLGLCVLALLARSDSYAYEIASQLSASIGMGEGTIYPLMRRMQTDGQVETYLVESSSGPSRKYYRLTDKGRESLKTQAAEWESFARAVGLLISEAHAAPADDIVTAAAPEPVLAISDASAASDKGAE